MREEISYFYEQKSRIVIKNLMKHNINALFAKDKEAALQIALGMTDLDATLGLGDSLTLEQIGLLDILRRKNLDRLYDPFNRSLYGKGFSEKNISERLMVMRKALTSDIFFTGVNAITMDGKLISVDGLGNRVAGMIFGPKKVIIVAGANKIVRNVEEGLRRVKEKAAPITARMHYLYDQPFEELPCVKIGDCVDCNSVGRICCYTVIIEYNNITFYKEPRINVIIVGEELGN